MNEEDKYYRDLFENTFPMITGMIIGIIVCAFISYFSFQSCNGRETIELKPDTVYCHDTIVDSFPVPVKETLVKYVRKPVHDTIREKEIVYVDSDSTVVIPIMQKEYTDDSTYTAWVSGYEQQLDSIHVYRQNMIITRRERIEAPRWNISLGGGAGYGLFNQKPDIFVGVTVGYRLDLFHRNKREKDPP